MAGPTRTTATFPVSSPITEAIATAIVKDPGLIARIDPGLFERLPIERFPFERFPFDRIRPTLPIEPAPPAPAVSFDTIPIARDGDVITAEYHYALRQAVIVLAEVAGVAELTRTTLQPGLPALLAVGDKPQWDLASQPGVAVKPAPANGDVSAADGWLPLRLPHLARMEKLRVTGRRTGTVGELTVRLVRQSLRDPATKVTLAALTLAAAPESFREETAVTVQDATPSALEELRRVDNGQYAYYATATLAGAAQSADVRLTAIQVVTQG